MKNYWSKQISQSDFITAITKAENLSSDEVTELSGIITNDPLTFYVVFEENQLKTFLAFDGSNAVFPSQGRVSASKYDAGANTSTHIYTPLQPMSQEPLAKFVFTEDFANGVLLNDTTPIAGFSFSSSSVSLTVSPPIGPDGPPHPYSLLCCKACHAVHSLLGISAVNCICCFYIGGCGDSCFGKPTLDTPSPF